MVSKVQVLKRICLCVSLFLFSWLVWLAGDESCLLFLHGAVGKYLSFAIATDETTYRIQKMVPRFKICKWKFDWSRNEKSDREHQEFSCLLLDFFTMVRFLSKPLQALISVSGEIGSNSSHRSGLTSP